MESVLPAERFFGAMRKGLRYVRHAPEVQAVIVRGTTFVLCASALWALLPVVARTELKQGPSGYGLLLAALGAGAVSGAFALPRFKRNSSTDGVAAAASLVFAAGMAALGGVVDRHVAYSSKMKVLSREKYTPFGLRTSIG